MLPKICPSVGRETTNKDRRCHHPTKYRRPRLLSTHVRQHLSTPQIPKRPIVNRPQLGECVINSLFRWSSGLNSPKSSSANSISSTSKSDAFSELKSGENPLSSSKTFPALDSSRRFLSKAVISSTALSAEVFPDRTIPSSMSMHAEREGVDEAKIAVFLIQDHFVDGDHNSCSAMYAVILWRVSTECTSCRSASDRAVSPSTRLIGEPSGEIKRASR